MFREYSFREFLSSPVEILATPIDNKPKTHVPRPQK